MNQRALKTAAYRLIREYRRNANSADVVVKTQWTDGMLRGAQDMWRLVLGYMKPGGPLWESRRYKALEAMVKVGKEFHTDCRIGGCTFCRTINKSEALL